MTKRFLSWPRRTGLFTVVLFAACGSPPPAECPAVPAPPPPPAPVAVVTTAPAAAPAIAATDATPAAPATPDLVSVTVTNPSSLVRPRETVTITAAALKKIAPGLELDKTVVVDAGGARVLSELVPSTAGAAPSELVFQVDLGAGETKLFHLRVGERQTPPEAAYEVYGRFVRERFDDFAWENDLVAHRMYGPALETAKQDALVSSGIDVWAKRVPRLVVNEWYLTGDYHEDHGEGADVYSVGKSRGCGGLGIWAKNELRVSRNFVTSRVLANGPIRLVFELDYAPWDAGGTQVSETKRVTLDAGSQFNHFESTFTSKKSPLEVGLGIAKHPGAALVADPASASLRVWEPTDGNKNSNIGCAVALPPGTHATEQQTDDSTLLVTKAKPGEPLSYYVGSAWDRAGHITSAGAWGDAVKALSARLAAPVLVDLSTVAAAPAPAAPPNLRPL